MNTENQKLRAILFLGWLIVSIMIVLLVLVNQSYAQSVWYVYNTEVVNVRAEADITSAIVGHLLYADPVEVIGEDGVWYQVEADVLLDTGEREMLTAWVHSYYLTEQLPWLTSHQQTGGAYQCDCSLTCEYHETFESAMYQYLGCSCLENVTINSNGYPVACDYKFDTSAYVPLHITVHSTVIYGN